jgi:NADH-quinone oxidoreductase subunit J
MHAVAYILAALTLAGMAAAMSLRNLVHCVLALALGFAGLAALYLHLGAQFIGFTQVLVYVGAVSILAVFVIMMTQRPGQKENPETSAHWLSGLILAAAVFAILAWAMHKGAASLPMLGAKPQAGAPEIGAALMHGYVLPLEIMGVLLTAALIGAVVLAMSETEGRP